jgi:hypothetical protein
MINMCRFPTSFDLFLDPISVIIDNSEYTIELNWWNYRRDMNGDM